MAVREILNNSRSSTSSSSVSDSTANVGMGNNNSDGDDTREVTLADIGIKSDTAVTVQLMG